MMRLWCHGNSIDYSVEKYIEKIVFLWSLTLRNKSAMTSLYFVLLLFFFIYFLRTAKIYNILEINEKIR